MSVIRPGARWYNAVWRWHFYAGMLCIPFVIWLALTGTLYLWKPQIEALIDRPYAHVATKVGPRADAASIATAAVAAMPGSTFKQYQLPDTTDQAVQLLVDTGSGDVRVYVHPQTRAILKTVAEEDRLMRLVFRLHGELLIGDSGSWIVETAACWAIVMILTGLYLWWPRGATGLAGVLWPRLRRGGRAFWRDIHAVTGIWVSFLALLLILTGLPWANGWGSYLKEVRAITGAVDGPQDWTTGGTHEGHGGHHMAMPRALTDLVALDRIVPNIAPLGLASPVLIAPPSAPDGLWTARSDAADRPLRVTLKVDGASGTILSSKDFADRHWIDRAVGYGIAAHEGALFGLANQILGTLTAAGLVLLATSGAILWWRRRPVGLLGAPIPLGRPRFGPLLIVGIALLAILFPMFGLTLVAILFAEWLVFHRIPGLARWLGLVRAKRAAAS
jgi:uncharacterized iron-regulated membrane protein